MPPYGHRGATAAHTQQALPPERGIQVAAGRSAVNGLAMPSRHGVRVDPGGSLKGRGSPRPSPYNRLR